MSMQYSPYHTALRCAFSVALHHGVQLAPEDLSAISPEDTLASMMRVLDRRGMKTKSFNKGTWKDIVSLDKAYPVIAQLKGENWVIVLNAVSVPGGGKALAVLDPLTEADGVKVLTQVEFEDVWSGRIVLAKRAVRLTDEDQPFGFLWFMPEILRNAASFRGIAITALMSSCVSFAIPMLLQILVDKVITHRSYQTLTVVALVFVVVAGFDCVFSYLRQRLMIFASNRIDARLASRMFQHLVSLPMPFFENSSAGVLARHMQQTEKVRQFLTGRLLHVALETLTLPILLAFLLIYSSKLTFIVLGFSAAMAVIIGVMVPTFRRHLDKLYQSEAARQAHVVETIHGMRAVKSLVLEASRQKAWDEKVAQAIRRHAAVGRLGAFANALTSAVEKLMQISVLSFGAMEVIEGSLSMGALVAFNMLSGRVTGPLVQMVALINEYQEAALSVKMLGTVMNTKPEQAMHKRTARPVISGRMEFDQVCFRYPGSPRLALDRVSFTVEEGQVIGVVGRSGSGKTTVTKLVQSIYLPESGMIRLDGTDIRHIDLLHLRRSIGVVLQENLLFRGTIRENIAAAKPAASLQEVMEAARLAGADEFIDKLPESYDTFVEESAYNFSGGQRQRIAIARALLVRPRLLILDEATSALDPDSEVIIQQNLGEIARGRTMIIVSHRLASLVSADAILVLEQGKLVDFAPHGTLLERCDIYRHLWQQQNHHLQ